MAKQDTTWEQAEAEWNRREAKRRGGQSLLEFVIQTARSVAVGQREPLRQEFVDDAPSKIYQTINSFDLAEPFQPWCRTVLRRDLIDRGRKQIRQNKNLRKGPNGATDQVEDTRSLSPGDDIDFKSTFSKADLDKIANWPLRTRLIALAIAGLWHKVPASEVSRWCREEGVSEPYPPDTFWDESHNEGRFDVLSTVLSMNFEAVKRSWYRARQKELRELDYVKHLSDEDSK